MQSFQNGYERGISNAGVVNETDRWTVRTTGKGATREQDLIRITVWPFAANATRYGKGSRTSNISSSWWTGLARRSMTYLKNAPEALKRELMQYSK